MGAETISRRYATALADVVIKSGELDTVQTELKNWQEMLDTNSDLYNAFHNPSISHESKEKILETMIERSGPSRITANFLKVLLRNHRLIELGSINDRFQSVLEERRGLVSAKVTSSRELTETEKVDLKTNLAKMTGGKEIKLNFEIDESIIGGAITRVGSTVYDGSVRTKLELLKEQMIKN